jgi:bifunctional DNase/RNase
MGDAFIDAPLWRVYDFRTVVVGGCGVGQIEMTIESIRVSLMNYQRVVILKEKAAERYLPIWIGPAEADAIAVRLQEVNIARPLTHDLLRTVIDSLGARVNSVVVNDLANDTFYARIVLDVNGRTMEIDSRPSDAIALAVRARVPIYADDSVLERAGVVIDEEGATERASEGASKVNDEELERMSAFRDFIESLDLDDFDRRRS